MMKYLRVLTGLVLSLFLIVTLAFANLLQMLSIGLRPFSSHGFRRVNGFIARAWWGLTVICSEKVQGLKVIILGDDIPANENALLIVNHQGLIDPLILLCLAYRKERLQDFKFYVKDILKYVPGVGWGMYFLDCIFLKRDWAKDKTSIERTFQRIVSENVPIWLVSFLEGTRLTPKKLAISQDYARRKGLKALHNLLLPRTKGFIATIQGLKTHLNAVYDVTIVYPKQKPAILDVVLGRLEGVVVHIRRFEISDLPSDEDGLTRYVNELFITKDRLIDDLKTQAY